MITLFQFIRFSPHIRQALPVFGLLALALAASLALQRPPLTAPPPTGGRTFFADSEGWYRITAREAAVVSPFDLSLDALPSALPMALGPWKGENVPLGPEVTAWYDNPEIAFQRAYSDGQGNLIWLTALGSRGPKSFRLFEHTPAICYPLSGWTLDRLAVAPLPVGKGAMPVQQGVAEHEGQRVVVLYWYLWDNPQRDPQNGVLSIRLAAPVRQSDDETLTMIQTGFVSHLFKDVVPWHRF